MCPTKIFASIAILVVFISIISCNKVADEQKGSSKIEISGTIIDTIKASYVIVNSSVILGKYGTITDHGFCWGISISPDLSGSHKSLGGFQTGGSFSSKLTGLLPSTKYYIRSYIQNSYNIIFGIQNEFTTLDNLLPEVSTAEITNITENSAQCGGNVTNDGNGMVSARGICWNTTGNPSLTNYLNKTQDGIGIGGYISQITGLIKATTYYLAAYATNEKGTTYGNELSFMTQSFSIGDSYGGGIIFYIDNTGLHGLIAATTTQSKEWGCAGTSIPGTSTNIGAGQTNTTAIVNGCSTAGIAARICYDLVLNGYNDWFLPSKDELNQMYMQKITIGGFANGTYWSSSDYGAFYAWSQFFNDGTQVNYDKSHTAYVRAIRAF